MIDVAVRGYDDTRAEVRAFGDHLSILVPSSSDVPKGQALAGIARADALIKASLILEKAAAAVGDALKAHTA